MPAPKSLHPARRQTHVPPPPTTTTTAATETATATATARARAKATAAIYKYKCSFGNLGTATRSAPTTTTLWKTCGYFLLMSLPGQGGVFTVWCLGISDGRRLRLGMPRTNYQADCPCDNVCTSNSMQPTLKEYGNLAENSNATYHQPINLIRNLPHQPAQWPRESLPQCWSRNGPMGPCP